jgi:hypothetical protein
MKVNSGGQWHYHHLCKEFWYNLCSHDLPDGGDICSEFVKRQDLPYALSVSVPSNSSTEEYSHGTS